MLNFTRPKLSDRPWIHEILYSCGKLGCEYSFANMYLWGDQSVARLGQGLAFYSRFHGDGFYVCPVGTELLPAIETLIDDAEQRRDKLRVLSVSPQEAAALESACPGRFQFRAVRSSYDYIYEIDRLADLGGRKLQAKRNHINRFLQEHPDWRVEPLCEENIDECREMIARWYCKHLSANEDADLSLEQRALSLALAHRRTLEMEGLCLRAGGKILAFTMGNRISETAFDVNFEKAYADVPGTYPLINREFARYLREKYPELLYLNREDDMGLEGLRKAKESYYPDCMAEKYCLTLREQTV